MSTVRDILKVKGNDVFAISPSATVLDALQEMADKGCGAILVMEGEQVMGIFSERDYARRVILQSKNENALIKDVMTEDVVFAEPHHSAEECMAQMTENRIRHLPVMENEKVVGVISIGDLVKSVITHQKHLIRSLEDYIVGKDYNR